MIIAATAWLGFLQVREVHFGLGVPDEKLNRMFAGKDGWIGADCATSVPVTPSSRWWLFSDTWIGKVKAGSRTEATIVNNTAAWQDDSNVSFVVRKEATEKPQALLTPNSGSGWFWMGPGTLYDHKLYVLLTQVEKTDPTTVFGFKSTGLWLGTVDRPSQDPADWTAKLLKVPFARFEAKREISFSFGLCKTGKWMMVYGTDEDVRPTGKDRYLLAARCPLENMQAFDKWQFWTGTGWSMDPGECRRTVGNMASDGSVSYLPKLGVYALVYTENGLSPRILVRTSASPVGPWSAPTEVYRCPDGDNDKNVFCYQARNHPELARGNELVLSYCTNSFDFSEVVRNANLYFPQFVRVPIK